MRVFSRIMNNIFDGEQAEAPHTVPFLLYLKLVFVVQIFKLPQKRKLICLKKEKQSHRSLPLHSIFGFPVPPSVSLSILYEILNLGSNHAPLCSNDCQLPDTTF